MGGHSGRPRGKINECNYFSSVPNQTRRRLDTLKLSDSEIERDNRKDFTLVRNIIDDVNGEEIDDNNNNEYSRRTHTFCNLQIIETALNKTLIYDCHFDHVIEDSIKFVSKNIRLYIE